MSMTMAPGPIASTISAVTSTGARRPGTAAVVMTTSLAATSSASARCWAASSSGLSSLA
jgi:hypothetical protein